jgi:methylthioribulose-1-phosphate dehydratase
MKTLTLNQRDLMEAHKLAGLVRELNKTGHNPATSGNYSLRSETYPGHGLISESGIDKSQFTVDHFLAVEFETARQHETHAADQRKPSDETALHLAILKLTGAGCVLHTHFLESLLFADLYPGQDVITLEDMELLKGFKGIKTHEAEVSLPCFENTQDIDSLARQLPDILPRYEHVYGIMLRRHGLYVWGASVEEAKRHLQVFEYLCRYFVALKK